MKILFFFVSIALLAWITIAKTTSTHQRLITNNITRCAAIEIAAPARKIQQSSTILLELDLSLNSSKIYNEMFGQNASKKPAHQSNFICMDTFSKKLDSTSDAVFDNLGQLIELRNKRFSKDGLEKRDISVAISIAAALVSLLANVGTSIFFGLSIEELSSNVEYLNQQLNLDAAFSETIAQNTRIVAQKENEIAIATNMISTSFSKFRRVGACTTLKVKL